MAVKRLISLCMAILLIFGLAITAFASDPYQGYSYSTTDEGSIDVAAPQAYLPATVYGAKQLGVKLSSPEDMLFDEQGNLYICDAGSNSILIFSPEMKLIKTIDSFENNDHGVGLHLMTYLPSLSFLGSKRL